MIREQHLTDYLDEHEKWFDPHFCIYESELEAIKIFIPREKKGISIGIGNGRFARPLDINEGVERFTDVIEHASEIGIKVYAGTSENLPLPVSSYDYALLATPVCFIDDIFKTFWEVNKIIKPKGNFILGFVNESSPLGDAYHNIKKVNRFYRLSSFHHTGEIIRCLKETHFTNLEIIQTVFGELHMINEVQPYKVGYGEGGFIVIKAEKE
ncbi:MAG: methyltransferase domain-containing protein [Ignavibacteriaceae bacterium]